MKRLLLLLLLASPCMAQTNTFCASNLACSVTGQWTLSNANNTLLLGGTYPYTVAGLQAALTAIQGTPIAISSCTEAGTTVTCILATSPSIASGTLVNILGVSQPGYNGLYTTNGGTANTITYLVNSSGLLAATGGSLTTGFGIVDATGALGNISTQITNATGSIVIPAGVTVKLGPSVWTCSITTANLPCWQLAGDGAKLLGAGTGYAASDSVDPQNGEALGITNLIGSAMGSTTDMIHVTVTNPGIFFNGLVKGAKVSGLWINMSGSGQDALHVTAINDFEASDIAAYNFNGNGFHMEGSIVLGGQTIAGGGTCPGSTTCGQAYHWTLTRSRFSPPHANTTGAACFLDGVNGEVAYFNITATRCSGNNTNGGGAVGLLMDTQNTASGFGVDTGTIQGYFGNTANAAAAGGYGIQLKGNGSWPTLSNGTENSIVIQGSIIEHQFNPASGNGIACTSRTGTRSGAACGDIALVGTNAGGWSVANIDFANLGEGFSATASSQQDFGSPPFRASGNDTGPNAQGIRIDTQLNATAINQTEYGLNNVVPVNDAGFTGQTFHGLYSAPVLAAGGNAANFSTWSAVTGDGSANASGTGLWARNSGARFDAWIRNVETAAPGLFAGSTMFYADSTLHMLKSSYGAGSFFPVPQTGNTAGTHSDSGFYQTASVAGCTTAASIGGVCATPVTITWPVAFQDANYKMTCQGSGAITNFPIMGSVTARIAASATVQTMALTAAAASFATIECIAVHN